MTKFLYKHEEMLQDICDMFQILLEQYTFDPM